MSKITYLDYIAKSLPPEEVWEFQSCYLQRLPKTIKVVTSKISIQDFQNIVEKMWWELWKTKKSDCFYVHKFVWSSTLGQHFLHQWWFFYIQELSASMSAPLLDAKPWEMILDMCAAPGGKTVQLADTWSFVVANEPLNPRRKALIYNINRTWMINTAITNVDWSRFGSLYPEVFDKVLVDAPCSWEWMSYKTWWPISWNEWLVKSLARTQEKLLESAIKTCKSWWKIVYSTCTLNDIENEQVIESTINKHKWIVSLEFSKKYRPHRDHCGGFFVAVFVKTLQCNVSTVTRNQPQKIPDFNISPALQSTIKAQLKSDFGIDNLPSNILFFASLQSVYATTTDYLDIANKISFDKAGILIYDISRDGRYLPSHHLGNIFWHLATINTFTLSDKQSQTYSQQKDLSIEQNIQTTTAWFLILKRKNFWFSISKQVWDIIKNKMI